MSLEQPSPRSPEKMPLLPIDENLYEVAETLVSSVADPDRRATLEASIATSKESALKYTTWTFEHIIDPKKHLISSDGGEDVLEGPTHGLRRGFGNLGMALNLMGRKLDFPEDRRRTDFAMESAALRYAARAIRVFRENLEKTHDPVATAKALNIKNPDLYSNLITLASRLPQGVPERDLFQGL